VPPGSEGGPDAPGPPPCAGHLFCDDFSDPSFARWPARDSTAGPLVLDSQVFVSPPSALRVDVPPGPGVRASFLGTLLAMSGHRIVSASLKSGHTGPAEGEIDVLSAAVVPPPKGLSDYRVVLVARPDGSVVLEYLTPSYETAPVSGAVAAATTFDRFTLDLDFAEGKIVVLKNATAVTPAISIPELGDAAIGSTELEVKVGASFANNQNGGYQILVDDLTVD
jgi:hypothetical protein